MPVVPLFAPTETVAFGRALYLSPSQLSPETQAYIARIIGTSDNRLGITEQTMLDNFADENISAVGFLWCGKSTEPAWAFGSLQYFDWLKTGTPQMWLTDLCRMGKKEICTSPVGELLAMFNSCLLEHGISDMWLMVDLEDPVSAIVLKRVYEAYGFQEIRTCSKLNSILMKRTLCV